jgi:hypothetical protein
MSAACRLLAYYAAFFLARSGELALIPVATQKG